MRAAALAFVRRYLWLPAAVVLLASCSYFPSISDLLQSREVCSFDLHDVDAIRDYDFEGELQIPENAADKLEDVMVFAAELWKFAGKVDQDLAAACGAFTHDLGRTPRVASSSGAAEVCKETALALKDSVEEILLTPTTISVVVKPPRCSLDLHAFEACASACDEDFDAAKKGALACEAGKLSGTCDGSCKGTCEQPVSGACGGECDGACAAGFSGLCGGTCDGRCDGAPMSSGVCGGKCEGRCDAGRGACKGACAGTCRTLGEAACAGTCVGACTAQMATASCLGDAVPKGLASDCEAACNLKLAQILPCAPPEVLVKIEGGAEPAKIERLRAALTKAFPRLLAVVMGVGARAAKLAASAKGVVGEAEHAVEAIAKSAGTSAAKKVTRIAACFAPVVKEVAQVAVKLTADVTGALDVKKLLEAEVDKARRAAAGLIAAVPSALPSALPRP